jgi:dihydroflavonol-4-reductase
MRTLVTGGNGFIGSAIVRALISEGKKVRVLVRENSDTCNIKNLPVELVYGDIRNKNSLKKALTDCSILFHVAAHYRIWDRDKSLFYKINVDGTKNIMEAAIHAGVKRIVYTSSIAALGTSFGNKLANESTPLDMRTAKGHYKLSKLLAEKEVMRLINQFSLPAVIVNPTAPVGPGDIKPTPTGRVIREAALGKIPAYVNTGLNIVHVDDVAKGHLLALDDGVIGEKYILGGDNMSLRAILSHVAKITHHRPPLFRLSPEIVLPLAYLSEFWARISHGQEPMLTVDGVKLSRQRMYFSSNKARKQLGYQSRKAEKAIEDAVRWFQSQSTESNPSAYPAINEQ